LAAFTFLIGVFTRAGLPAQNARSDLQKVEDLTIAASMPTIDTLITN